MSLIESLTSIATIVVLTLIFAGLYNSAGPEYAFGYAFACFILRMGKRS